MLIYKMIAYFNNKSCKMKVFCLKNNKTLYNLNLRLIKFLQIRLNTNRLKLTSYYTKIR